MATFQEGFLKDIADILTESLATVYGEKMGFALLVFPFNTDTSKVVAADYVSNGRREDMIKAMREAADRFEAGEDIPRTEGTA
jgi:hypothetical protein